MSSQVRDFTGFGIRPIESDFTGSENAALTHFTASLPVGEPRGGILNGLAISYSNIAAIQAFSSTRAARHSLSNRRVTKFHHLAFPELGIAAQPSSRRHSIQPRVSISLGRSLNVVMAAEPRHQQQEDSPIPSFPDAKSSDDMSSSNVTDPEPFEKTADAEANLPQQQQKPVGGPPGGPPPNGGTTAWLQVLGGFFLFFNTWVCIRVLGSRCSMDNIFLSCLSRRTSTI
jgi:hypothetical protein